MMEEPITTANRDRLLAGRIAALMRAGTAAVCMLLLTGVLLTGLGHATAGNAVLTLGFGLLILIPLTMLVVMIQHFAQSAQKGFVFLTALVIALIGTGALLGTVL